MILSSFINTVILLLSRYYSVLSYTAAEKTVLRPPAIDGTFIVWASSQDDESKNIYILTYAYNKNYEHAK